MALYHIKLVHLGYLDMYKSVVSPPTFTWTKDKAMAAIWTAREANDIVKELGTRGILAKKIEVGITTSSKKESPGDAWDRAMRGI